MLKCMGFISVSHVVFIRFSLEGSWENPQNLHFKIPNILNIFPSFFFLRVKNNLHKKRPGKKPQAKHKVDSSMGRGTAALRWREDCTVKTERQKGNFLNGNSSGVIYSQYDSCNTTITPVQTQKEREGGI